MSGRKKMPRRTRETVERDREAILALSDGSRSQSEIAVALGRYHGDVRFDILALRRAGKTVRIRPPHPAMKKGACVYRHFDAAGRLLYVGCTANIFQRTSLHASGSKWFGEIVRIEIEHFPNGTEAMEAEAEAIRSENPIHNVSGRTRRAAAAAKSESAS